MGITYPLLLFFVKLLNHIQLCATLWTGGHQVPLSMEYSGQEYWSGSLFPGSGALPDPGVKPKSPALGSGFVTTEPPGKSIADPRQARIWNRFIHWAFPLCLRHCHQNTLGLACWRMRDMWSPAESPVIIGEVILDQLPASQPWYRNKPSQSVSCLVSSPQKQEP